MYDSIETIIHPKNRSEIGRLFIIEGLEKDEIRTIGKRVMDVYSNVTDKDFSQYSYEDYTEHIADKLASDEAFELRFGMPKLRYPASEHGKLRGKTGRIIVGDQLVTAAGFYVDTNDFSATSSQPIASAVLEHDFLRSIQTLADEEFPDITIPAPRLALFIGYNPAIAK